MRAVLLAARHQSLQSGHTALFVGGLGVAALTPVFLSWKSGSGWVEWMWAAIIGFHLVLGMLGTSLALAFQKQNQPALARLVPGHVRRLRAAQGASWLTLSLAHAIPHAHSLGPALFAVGVGAWVQAMLMTMAGARMRVWLPMLLGSFGLIGVLTAALVKLKEASLNGPGLAVALTLAACAVAALTTLGLCRLIRTGADAHRERYANLKPLFSLKAASGEARVQVGLPTWWMGALDVVYRRVWRQLLAAPTPANSVARFGLLAIKQGHWARQVLSIAVFALVVIAPSVPGFLAAGRGEPLDAWMVSQGKFVAFAFLLMGVVWLNDGVDLRAGRQEHALLVLLPGLPPAAQMARAWVTYRLRGFLITWAGSWGTALLVVAATGPQWLGHVALLASLGLGFSFALAAKWAVTGGAHQRKDWLLLLPIALLGLWVYLGLAPGAAAVFVLLSIAAGWVWLWPRIGRRPSPFPAGRLER